MFFFKIILDRIIYAADEDMKTKKDEWFKFIKLYRLSRMGRIQEFDLSKEGVFLLFQPDGSWRTESLEGLSTSTGRIWIR